MTTATDNITHLDLGRDPAYEDWLTSHHVEFTYEPALPIDEINTKASRSNQARFAELDPDVVARYAGDLADGDRFPPVLARRPGPRSKLVLLGGNHRHEAHLVAKAPTIAAYVVECEAETATVLMYEDNRRHGLPPSRQERIRQGIHLVNIGISQNEAARLVGVAGPEINRRMKLDEVDGRAREHGVPLEFGALADDARHQLGRVASDPVFTEAAKVAAASKMTAPEAKAFVVTILSQRSEADQLGVVGLELETRRAQMQAKAGGRIDRDNTPMGRLLASLRTVRAIDPVAAVRSCADAQQRKALDEACKAAAKHLMTVSQKVNG